MLLQTTSSWVFEWQKSEVQQICPDSRELFVTRMVPDAASASLVGLDISYALFRKKIPVLCLVDKESFGAQSEWMAALSKYKDASLGLLCVETYNNEVDLFETCQTWMTPAATPGNVIVLEGGDGAGKQTQAKLLIDRLNAEGYKCKTLDFPHDSAKYGLFIRSILAGDFGGLKNVHPLLFASLYGVNREDTAAALWWWVHKGYMVILDRFVSANYGHQSSKYENEKERHEVIATIEKFEFDWLQLPRPTVTLYLDLPPAAALAAMKLDTTRSSLDIHESAGDDYKSKVRTTFLWCVANLPNWKVVPCVDSETNRVSREDVHSTIWNDISPILKPAWQDGREASPT